MNKGIAHEAHTIECDRCLRELLVRGEVRIGDDVQCLACDHIITITRIELEPRIESELPTQHTSIILPV